MGRGKGGLPLTPFSSGEITSDTLLLARLASEIPFSVCFDLGTGTGGILANIEPYDGFSVGIDFSMDALMRFDLKNGQPVLCPVERICGTFRENCADLVVANPPYYSLSSSRPSPGTICE